MTGAPVVVVVGFAGEPLELPAGEPLSVSLAAAGVPVESPCGGRGRCGRCRVRLEGFVPPPSPADRELLSGAELAAGFRLACRHRPAPGMRVSVIAGGVAPGAGGADDGAARRKAALGWEPGFGVGMDYSLSPVVEKVFVRVAPPAEGEAGGDWERLAAALGRQVSPTLDALAVLPSALRRSGFGVTAVLGGGRLLAVEPGDTTGRLHGVVVDLGTTTLAVALVDLTSGSQLAWASDLNPQAALGADIMSRLALAFRPEGREELGRRVRGAVNRLIGSVLSRRGLEPRDVYAAAVVGNTAMHHLFLGLEVEQLGLAPFVPAVTAAVCCPAREAGLEINPAGLAYFLPNIGAFVGADLAGVLLATRLWEGDAPRLVIDLGTNGEMLLGDREGVLACSAPAGPAFEGGEISCGMRAGPGAIQTVHIGEDVSVGVVGGGPPRGLCGSGLVDAVAAMRRAGVVDATGRLAPEGGAGLSPRLRERLRTGADGVSFVLAWPEPGGKPVAVTQRDVRQLQLAKAAVRAGAEVLMRERGITAGDLAEVLLAGTFGNYINVESALDIGLLPPVPAERVRPVGNAAAAGAALCLLSAEARRAAEAAARRVRHVPLATRSDFQEIFLASTGFPDIVPGAGRQGV